MTTHQEQEARQRELDRLYEADGRHNPHHPHHATYTGLAEPADGPAVPEGRGPAAVTSEASPPDACPQLGEAQP